MPQHMIHQYNGDHGLGNGRGAYADTGIMPALGPDLYGLTMDIDGLPGYQNAGGRLEGDTGNDILSARNATQDSARIVSQKSGGRHLITVLRAFLFDTGKSGADLDALDGVDAHQRMGDICIQPVEDRL